MERLIEQIETIVTQQVVFAVGDGDNKTHWRRPTERRQFIEVREANCFPPRDGAVFVSIGPDVFNRSNDYVIDTLEQFHRLFDREERKWKK